MTRIELLALLAAILLWTAIVTPLLGQGEMVAGHTVCANNLRLVGRAFQVWSQERGQVMPWRLPLANGGTLTANKPGLAWWEFSWFSNELVTPRILACPSDVKVRPARDFSQQSDGGFLHIGYRNRALSYFVAADVGYVDGFLRGSELTPNHFLSGDRNLAIDIYGQNCSAGFNNVDCIVTQTGQRSWTQEVHDSQGNILFNNGSVQQLTTPTLRRALPSANGDNILHLLRPQ